MGVFHITSDDDFELEWTIAEWYKVGINCIKTLIELVLPSAYRFRKEASPSDTLGQTDP